ncbi:uncharacterized protein LOC117730243 isoform X2 [Cyclopterus lumpus]|uniref:uncharacterized protein LOC117730243 isoform X2 n=1 Tax=Cyclopterus lumpus TaxID=8103 RepID=UPI00148747FD|nr:uncharacterized protein LOC117730243 isoform X2 [Cyclopterus lumpus]
MKRDTNWSLFWEHFELPDADVQASPSGNPWGTLHSFQSNATEETQRLEMFGEALRQVVEVVQTVEGPACPTYSALGQASPQEEGSASQSATERQHSHYMYLDYLHFCIRKSSYKEMKGGKETVQTPSCFSPYQRCSRSSWCERRGERRTRVCACQTSCGTHRCAGRRCAGIVFLLVDIIRAGDGPPSRARNRARNSSPSCKHQQRAVAQHGTPHNNDTKHKCVSGSPKISLT